MDEPCGFKTLFDEIFSVPYQAQAQPKPQPAPKPAPKFEAQAKEMHTYSGKKLEHGFNSVFNVFHWCVLTNLHNLDPVEFHYAGPDVKLTEKAALSYAQFCETLKAQG